MEILIELEILKLFNWCCSASMLPEIPYLDRAPGLSCLQCLRLRLWLPHVWRFERWLLLFLQLRLWLLPLSPPTCQHRKRERPSWRMDAEILNTRSYAPKPINGTYKSIIKQFKYKRGCLEVLCVKYSGFIWNSMVISYPGYRRCFNFTYCTKTAQKEIN